jgi:hypothetical protein
MFKAKPTYPDCSICRAETMCSAHNDTGTEYDCPGPITGRSYRPDTNDDEPDAELPDTIKALALFTDPNKVNPIRGSDMLKTLTLLSGTFYHVPHHPELARFTVKPTKGEGWDDLMEITGIGPKHEQCQTTHPDDCEHCQQERPYDKRPYDSGPNGTLDTSDMPGYPGPRGPERTHYPTSEEIGGSPDEEAENRCPQCGSWNTQSVKDRGEKQRMCLDCGLNTPAWRERRRKEGAAISPRPFQEYEVSDYGPHAETLRALFLRLHPETLAHVRKDLGVWMGTVGNEMALTLIRHVRYDRDAPSRQKYTATLRYLDELEQAAADKRDGYNAGLKSEIPEPYLGGHTIAWLTGYRKARDEISKTAYEQRCEKPSWCGFGTNYPCTKWCTDDPHVCKYDGRNDLPVIVSNPADPQTDGRPSYAPSENPTGKPRTWYEGYAAGYNPGDTLPKDNPYENGSDKWWNWHKGFMLGRQDREAQQPDPLAEIPIAEALKRERPEPNEKPDCYGPYCDDPTVEPDDGCEGCRWCNDGTPYKGA